MVFLRQNLPRSSDIKIQENFQSVQNVKFPEMILHICQSVGQEQAQNGIASEEYFDLLTVHPNYNLSLNSQGKIGHENSKQIRLSA